jgi:hypothetical protein
MAEYEQIMIRYPHGSGMLAKLKAEAAARTKPGGGRTTLNEYLTELIATHPERKRKEAKAKK